jgi:cytosine/adenosine deaminase-related metal-dependent hydrolase
MSHKILIRGGWVASMDEQLGDIPGGDVLIEDDVIRAVGGDLGGVDAEIIDAAGKLVVPGMVDTHRHTWQTQMRGICADMTLIDYMNTIRLAISPNYTPDDVYIGNKLGALEALNAGVTTLLDFSHCNNSPDHSDAAVTGLRDSGIRGLFSYGFFDSSPETTTFASHAERVQDFERIVDTYSGEARLTFGVALTEVGLIPWPETVAEIQAARRMGGRIAVHTGCFWGSVVNTGIKEMAAAGLLGPDHVHIHGMTLDEEDWQLLSEAGVHISIAPETELNMGMGWPVFEQCRSHGLRPTLSCDVISLNSGDLLSQMRLALAAYRFADNEPVNRRGEMPATLTATSRDAFRWATVNGAAACGLESVVGSLAPGRQADVVVIGNRGSFTGQPAINPLGSAIFQATPSDVWDVFVAGRGIKRNGALVGVDLPALFSQAHESAEAILEKVHRAHPVLPPPVEGSDYEELERNARANLALAYASSGS